MLKSWSIENFKSFQGKTTVELGYLTVLCGANSSGKSSIIQSILLAKQTISGTSRERALALNGALLKLGRFEDVCHFAAENKFFGFSGEFDTIATPATSSPNPTTQLGTGGPNFLLRRRKQYESIKFEARLSATGDSDLEQLQPYLIYTNVEARYLPYSTETTSSETNNSERPKDLNVTFRRAHKKFSDKKTKLMKAKRIQSQMN